MLINRLKQFVNEDCPKFIPYIPSKKDDLVNLNLEDTLNRFEELRKEFIDILKSMNEENRQRQGNHPEYKEYTPYIMARHVFLHDYVHMYRIEELGFIKEF